MEEDEQLRLPYKERGNRKIIGEFLRGNKTEGKVPEDWTLVDDKKGRRHYVDGRGNSHFQVYDSSQLPNGTRKPVEAYEFSRVMRKWRDESANRTDIILGQRVA